MARGGKREGAGRPLAQHTIEAEAAKAALIESFVKDKEKVFTALLKRAKAGDVPAIKGLFDRVWGKSVQPISNDGDKPFMLTWKTSSESKSTTNQENGPSPSTLRISA